MRRLNPGIFEPLVYLIQKPRSFRLVGLGGLLLFSIVMLSEAFGHGVRYGLAGLVLLAALWVESSLTACRRCRYYGTWHCLGQGMLAAKVFPRIGIGAGEALFQLHIATLGIYLFYGLFWIWHTPILGIIFTLWVPLLLISAQAPNGFSWRARKA